MIFVTVGMHTKPFERLIRAADDMTSYIDEPIIIQRGVSKYSPKSCQYFDFAEEAQVQKWLSKARIIVSHCGAGSIIHVIQTGKPLVVVPRLKRFNEHIDDHQLELAEVLAKQDKAVVVVNLSAEKLLQAVMRANKLVTKEYTSTSCSLQAALRAWLDAQFIQKSGAQSRRFRKKG